MNTKKQIFALVLPLMLGLLTGCTSLSLKKPDVWPFNISDDKPGTPNQIVANWTDTILYQPNQVPMRGFGGRVMFYADGKKTPIKAEGTLSVYAFDEKDRDPSNVKPDRKFIFTKDQLAMHYSKSKIGHSYSVWIPWDEAGGNQKQISLIVRFTPEKGNVVVSEQTKHLLPGKTESILSNPNALASTAGNGAIQPVSYESPAMPANSNDPGKEPKRSMTTTTIALPPSSVLKSPPVTAVGQVANLPKTGGSGQVGNLPHDNLTPAANPAVGGEVNSANSSSPQNSVCPPPARFEPGQPPAPSSPYAQSALYRAPWQQRPSRSTFAPGVLPVGVSDCGRQASPGVAGSPTN
jgi:hypothetical protein